MAYTLTKVPDVFGNSFIFIILCLLKCICLIHLIHFTTVVLVSYLQKLCYYKQSTMKMIL